VQRVHGVAAIVPVGLEVDDDFVHVASSAGIETFLKGYRLFRCKQLDVGNPAELRNLLIAVSYYK
jgi:hypothetical protein